MIKIAKNVSQKQRCRLWYVLYEVTMIHKYKMKIIYIIFIKENNMKNPDDNKKKLINFILKINVIGICLELLSKYMKKLVHIFTQHFEK